MLVIIPTYNERGNLKKLVAQLQDVPGLETVIVDDNSPDGTGRLADELAGTYARLHVLHRPRKEGLGKAYQAGFTWALERSYDFIATMDADFSHDPAYLPKLIELAQSEADVAVGSRYVPGGRIVGWSPSRYLLSWGANLLTKTLLGLKPRDVTAGFKCYRRAFLASLNLQKIVSPGYAFQVEMLLAAQRGGFQIRELPITFTDRTVGRSKVSRHELIVSLKSLLRLAWERRGLRELAKFSIVGTLNFAIDLGLTNLGIAVFGWPPVLAGYAGVGAALIHSFFLNRRWTFRVKSTAVVAESGRFLLINGTGALFNAGFYTLFLLVFHLPYNGAKIAAIGVGAVWNFLGTKFWVFSGQPGLREAKLKADRV